MIQCKSVVWTCREMCKYDIYGTNIFLRFLFHSCVHLKKDLRDEKKMVWSHDMTLFSSGIIFIFAKCIYIFYLTYFCALLCFAAEMICVIVCKCLLK